MSTANSIGHGDAPPSAARDRASKTDPVIGSTKLPALIGRAVTVNCSPSEAYQRWRDLAQLHRFLVGVRQVEVLDERRARILVGDEESTEAEWELEVIEDEAPRLIAWRALQGQEAVHEGKVEFSIASGGRGTVVTATLALKSPTGRVSQWWQRLFHPDPRMQAERELRRFKQWIETGEVSTSAPPAAAPRAS